MRARRAGLLLLLLQLGQQQRQVRAQARTPGEILAFNFNRSECLQGGPFRDLAGNGFLGDVVLGNVSTTYCLQGNGLGGRDGGATSVRAESTRNVTKLVKYLETLNAGMTVEIWLQFQGAYGGAGDDEVFPAAAVVKDNPNDDVFLQCSTTGRTVPADSVGFVLGTGTESATSGAVMFANYVLQSQTDARCSSDLGATLNPNDGTAHHLVISMPPLGTPSGDYYYDGVLESPYPATGQQSSNDFDVMMGRWNKESLLRLFGLGSPGSSVNAPFAGEIYYLAMYDFPLSSAQVADNYAAGVPPSAGYALGIPNAEIKEDGEVGDHHGTPIYYRFPVPDDELVLVNLTVYDYDNDAAGVVNSSVVTAVARITNFTSTLKLYDPDNSDMEITGADLPYTFSPGQYVLMQDLGIIFYQVRVRPPRDLKGVGTEFNITFDVVDGGHISAPAETTISRLIGVEDPPIALTQTVDTPVGGSYDITLQYSDVDSAANKIDYYICSLPENGTLKDGGTITQGNLPHLLSGTDVTYHPDASSVGDADPSGFIGFDRFCFYTANPGAVGMQSNVTLRLLSSLTLDPDAMEAQYQSSFTVPEGDSTFDITAADLAESGDADVLLEFLSVTVPPEATLRFGGVDVVAGMNVTMPALTNDNGIDYFRVTLDYSGPVGSFNFPTADMLGFPLSTVVIGPMILGMRVLSAAQNSATYTRQVNITNINDATTIEGPDKVKVKYQKGEFILKTRGTEPIVLTDPDYGVDPIVARVQADTGRPGLNSSFIGLTNSVPSCIAVDASFACAACSSLSGCDICACTAETCTECNDAFLADNFAIAGYVPDVERALNNIWYRYPSGSDSELDLTIDVYDGFGGFRAGCIDIQDAEIVNNYPNSGAADYSSGCHKETLTITVQVEGLPGDTNPNSFLNLDLPLWSLPIILISMFCFVSAIMGFFRKKLFWALQLCLYKGCGIERCAPEGGEEPLSGGADSPLPTLGGSCVGGSPDSGDGSGHIPMITKSPVQTMVLRGGNSPVAAADLTCGAGVDDGLCGPPPPGNPEDDPQTWRTYETDENLEYYYNTATKRTVWERPACMATVNV